MAWWDDNGFHDTNDQEQVSTACNPSGLINDQYELCQNNGNVLNPDWECDVVTPSVESTPQPDLLVSSCGELTWDLYGELDVGKGGIAPGNCQGGLCTTTDSFASYYDGEAEGGPAFCEINGGETTVAAQHPNYAAVVAAIVSSLPL